MPVLGGPVGEPWDCGQERVARTFTLSQNCCKYKRFFVLFHLLLGQAYVFLLLFLLLTYQLHRDSGGEMEQAEPISFSSVNRFG